MALKQIKNKIISTKKTGKVTKAMESVSAVKMRKSQIRAFESRPYVHAAMRILSRLAQTSEVQQHPLSLPRSVSKKLVIIVTSDKGLAGSVNSAVLKQVEQLRAEGDIFDVVAIGRKALEFARRGKLVVIADYTNVSDNVTLADVYKMSEVVMQAFIGGNEYGKVEIVYQNFISTFEQSPTKRQVLPLDPAEVNYIMRGIKPKHGKFSEEVLAPDAMVDYEIEPSASA
ncbi:hypothetical protein CO026_03435, partial [Candidatus Kaiserbacteria bacterium CG_4_9_14_0_2_um_filter_41_32]